jgi:hypothetical protein
MVSRTRVLDLRRTKGGGWLVFTRAVCVRGGDRRRQVGRGQVTGWWPCVWARAHAADARTRGFRLPVVLAADHGSMSFFFER